MKESMGESSVGGRWAETVQEHPNGPSWGNSDSGIPPALTSRERHSPPAGVGIRPT